MFLIQLQYCITVIFIFAIRTYQIESLVADRLLYNIFQIWISSLLCNWNIFVMVMRQQDKAIAVRLSPLRLSLCSPHKLFSKGCFPNFRLQFGRWIFWGAILKSGKISLIFSKRFYVCTFFKKSVPRSINFIICWQVLLLSQWWITGGGSYFAEEHIDFCVPLRCTCSVLTVCLVLVHFVHRFYFQLGCYWSQWVHRSMTAQIVWIFWSHKNGTKNRLGWGHLVIALQ